MYSISAVVLNILLIQHGVRCAEETTAVFDTTVGFQNASGTLPVNTTEGMKNNSSEITVEIVQPVLDETLVLNSTDGIKDITENDTLYLTCMANTLFKWVYQNSTLKEPVPVDSLWNAGSSRIIFPNSTMKLNPRLSYLDTGRYSCVSKDTNETIGSVYVFVYQKKKHFVRYGKRGKNEDVYENKPLVIPCMVTNSKANVTLWKGKSSSELGKRVLLNSSLYDPTKGFLIPHATGYFKGTFRCLAEINGKVMTKTWLLYFYRETKRKPDVGMNTARDVSILVNSTLTLKCNILIEKGAIFTENWTHPVVDGKKLYIKVPVRVGYNDTFENYEATLTLENAQKEDSGLYKCNFTDHSDKWNYKEANVHVLDPEKPSFTESNLTSITMLRTPGEKVEILCNDITGFPKPWVKWYRNSNPFDDVSTTEIRMEDNKQKLVINRFHPDDSGVYQCSAENGYGAVSRNIILLIKTVYSF